MLLSLYGTLRDAIAARLAADPAVSALAPVIHERPPGDARAPFITIEPALLADWSNKTAAGVAAEIRIIILLADDDDSAAEAAGEAVLAALATPPPLTGARLVRLAARTIRILRPRQAGRQVTIQLDALVAEDTA